ncbi:MAG TPA: CDP-alcohol phosphatidyltransferase family protein [Planctomycetes bacterium]|nr:CDP-alcohol phosphatidyltransferase family protein [Planctomycetota bacterium]
MDTKNDNRLVRLIPNGLTLSRLVLTLVFLSMILYSPHTGSEKPAAFLMVAFTLFVIAGLTDIFDGPVARAFGVTSKFGRMVDPLADKILVGGAFICFVIVRQPTFTNIFSPCTETLIQWTTAIVIIAREVFVTILRHIAEARGVSFAATVTGKVKMFVQSFGIGTVMIKWAFVSRPWGDWFTVVTFAIMLLVTVVSGIKSLQRPRR